MCGIVGYVGGENAAKVVLSGLEQLEYRGYDSAGLAVMDGGKVTVIKRRGRVEKLCEATADLAGNLGIGHTRWATHGKPCDANAHPHTYGRITIVHNGIIENYAELKARLSAEGEVFSSETDSEIIAHLIDRFYSGDLLKAVIKCARMLSGSYALLAICEGREEIVAAMYRSSVIVGSCGDNRYCASDEPALAGKCVNMRVLEDGDFAVLSRDGIKIYDSEQMEIDRPIVINRAQPAALALGGYPHYMLKELWESPAAVKNTLTAMREFGSDAVEYIKRAKKIVFTGCGTAYHAALLGKRYMEDFTDIAVSAEYAGELRYNTARSCENVSLIAVTQSGETADVVEAARLYKSLGASIIAVTNSPHSAITRIADAVVPVAAGSEICVAATKSYSGQVAALLYLALQISGCTRRDIASELENAPSLILKTLDCIDIYALADMCAHCRGVYFMGRGIDYAVALEGSLKLKEVSYLPGGGYPASELKHGTLALIDGGTLSVFIICDETLYKKSAAAVEQVLSRGGKAALITTLPQAETEFCGRAEVIKLPPCGKYVSPLLSAAVLQFLAYRTAVISGKDPDKPRNLAKSVTVE